MHKTLASAALALVLTTLVVPSALAGASRIPAGGGRVPASVLQQAEMSLMVAGTVDIDAHGKVSALSLVPSPALNATLEAFVREQVAGWQFEPGWEGGEVASANTPMALKLVSRSDGEGGAVVRITSAHFGDNSAVPVEHRLSKRNMVPPRYPLDVARMGGAGEVFLLLKVGPDGKVMDSGATHVNLTRAGSERTMMRVRERLAQAAVEASRSWEFDVPTAGPDAGQPYWLTRVPVNFALTDSLASDPTVETKWRPYIPGPRLEIAWYQRPANENAAAVEAMPQGEPTLVGSTTGPRLATSLEG